MKLTSVLFILLSIGAFSQSKKKENLINKFLVELKQQKIDTICFYQDYSNNGAFIFEEENRFSSCDYDFDSLPTYIFWKKNGDTFLTRKDNCSEYSIIKVNFDNVWKFLKHKKTIEKENIKPFQSIEIDHKKRTKTLTTVTASENHHQNFIFFVKNERIEKKFNDLDLKKNYEELININYIFNQNLKSKVLVDIISQLILNSKKEISEISK